MWCITVALCVAVDLRMDLKQRKALGYKFGSGIPRGHETGSDKDCNRFRRL